MEEISYGARMSENDTVLWRIEQDPLLRSTVTSAWLLESVPDRDRLDAVVHAMVATMPRLRQRVGEEFGGLSTPRWDYDPNFDVNHHYQWTRLAGTRPTRRRALDYVAQFAARAFDRDRPLWELMLIEGLPNKRAVFIIKVHHAISDGLGMVQMLGQLVDLEADPVERLTADPPPPPAGTRSALRPSFGIVDRVTRDAVTARRYGLLSASVLRGMVTDPVRTTRGLGALTRSIAHVVKPAPAPMSPLMVGRGLSPRFDTIMIPLDDLKAGAKTAGGSLNDGFVAGVLSGLHRYHEEMGVPTETIRMNMPISVRGGDDENQSSNQFVPARVVLPLGEKSAAERVAETRDLLGTVRSEPALPIMSDISGAIRRLGQSATVAIIGSMMKGVDVTTSNVPGPPFPVWVAGRKVNEFFAFGPLAGSAVNLTLFSYDGWLFIGINSDKVAITDADRFVSCIEDGLAEIVALGS